MQTLNECCTLAASHTGKAGTQTALNLAWYTVPMPFVLVGLLLLAFTLAVSLAACASIAPAFVFVSEDAAWS